MKKRRNGEDGPHPIFFLLSPLCNLYYYPENPVFFAQDFVVQWTKWTADAATAVDQVDEVDLQPQAPRLKPQAPRPKPQAPSRKPKAQSLKPKAQSQ